MRNLLNNATHDNTTAGPMKSEDSSRTVVAGVTGVAAGVVDIAQRRVWGRAYRGGRLVCARVHITIGRDDRLGLARHERRYVIARFEERLDRGLRSELTQLARRRGAAAHRVADVLEAIEFVVDEPAGERQHIVGRLQPPQLRHGWLRDIEFVVRELEQTR